MSADERDLPVDLNTVSVLIPKSRTGDDTAREELLTLIQGYLESTAKRNMDPSLRQKLGESDIVQQSFLRVIENFEKFKGQSSAEFHGWLKAIVVNEIRNTRRGFRANKRDVGREKASVEDVGTVDHQLTPSSEAISEERRNLFAQILSQLSPDHAEVIRLRNLEQLSFKEIGEAMDRSEDACSKLWYRAMLKFEELLKASGNFKSWQESSSN